MKASLLRSFCFILFFSFLGISSTQAQLRFTANLSGQNEVFPVATLASGTVTAYLSGQKLVLEGSFSGLTDEVATNILGGAHLHIGMAGQSGPVLIPIRLDLDADRKGATIDPLKNIHTLTVAQMDFLTKRRIYVNVHSLRYTGGEIRGQLLPDAEEFYHANLFGSNENPGIMTTANGAVDLELNGDELTLSGSFSNLSSPLNTAIAGGAHIHVGLPGENGAVVFPLTPNTSPDGMNGIFVGSKNTFTLTPSQLDDLRARRFYVNIHSMNFAGGELRGQIVGHARALYRAHLSGMNAVPSQVITGGLGVFMAEIVDEETIHLFGNFNSLESEVATNIMGGLHLHRGLAGQTGPVELGITTDFAPDLRGGKVEVANNTFTVSSTQMNNFLNRSMYANIHTTSNLSGEIRGQLLLESQMYFTGLFSGTQEVTPVISDGYGTLKGELSGNSLVITGAFDQMESSFDPTIAGGSHLHIGYAGQNGGIAHNIVPTVAATLLSGRYEANDNIITLTDTEKLAMMSRQFYANIHTTGTPSGELRAQMLFEANNYYFAILSGASETPPANTPGFGALAAESTGATLRVSGAFSNLSSAFDPNIAGGSHIHTAIAGRNGAIGLTLKPELDADMLGGTFSVADNNFALSGALLSSLRDRMNYANLHSVDFPGGELRGQFLPPAAAYFTTSISSENQDPQLFTGADGGLRLELRGDRLVVTGSFDNLASDFDPNIAGGAHLHLGTVGTNGMVAVRLSPTPDADNRGGMLLASDNSFVLSPDNVDYLKRQFFYANIHSVNNPAGEPRGQVLPMINFFPTSTDINTPADDAVVMVEGMPTNTLDINWSPATDDTDLIYYWQLSSTDDFSDVIYSANAGLMSDISVDYATLDFILQNQGLAVGEMDTLYHRIVASDGSLRSPGMGKTVYMSRGSLTSSKGEENGKNWEAKTTSIEAYDLRIFPNPVVNQVTVNWESNASGNSTIRIYDINGSIRMEQNLSVYQGQNSTQFDFYNLPDGLYFLYMDGNQVQKVLKSSRP
ncbi:MAG: CHRD domain-containing protein [Saprospiraceae bacterium]